MADPMMSGNGKNVIPWQQIANWLFAALISVGAYVWNDTVANLRAVQKTNADQNESIARLQEQRTAQEWRNEELQRRLTSMEGKIDRLLREGPRVSP